MRRLFARTSRGRAPLRFLQSDDDRFTDAEILTILRAGWEAGSPDDVCAAEGIAPETYEVWKVKYGGLGVSQIKILRRRERRNRQTTLAVLCLVAVALGAGYAFIARRAVPVHQAQQASVDRARDLVVQPGPAVPAPAALVSPQAAEPADAISAPLAATRATPPITLPVDIATSGIDASARELDAAGPSGYSVQVAALPDLDEAQALIERLGRVGHPAYLTRTTFDEKLLYRVRVGPIESRDAADEVVRRLEIEGHRGSWVTK